METPVAGGDREPREGQLCGHAVRGAHPVPQQGALPLHPKQEGAPRPQDHHRHLQHRRKVLHCAHQQASSWNAYWVVQQVVHYT